MSGIKNVVLMGASGNLGPNVLNVFLKSPAYNVTVLAREGSKSTFPPGVKVTRIDYSSSSALKKAFEGQDAVLSLVGGPSLDDHIRFIDAAIAAGVKRFLPSEYGLNTADEKVQAIVPMLSAKSKIVEYLRSKESQISWNAVVTGGLIDWSFKIGLYGVDSTSTKARIIDGGDRVLSVTTTHTIGLALTKLLEKDEFKNQYVYISSFEVSQRGLVATAEKIRGVKYTITDVKSSDLLQSGREKLAKGDYSGMGDLIKAAGFSDLANNDFRSIGLWNEKLGLEKEDFEEVVRIGLSGGLAGEKELAGP